MEKSTFEGILEEYKDKVFSYAFYVLGNREDAEDVTQEVFIKLWEKLAEIDGSRYGAWVMSVAHNRCVDRARERRRSAHRNMELDRVPSIKEEDVRDDPESCLEFRETQRSLLRALKRLPAKTRSMLVLHYYQGIKYQMIGEMFNINVNTIKVEVHRGRKRLKEILANEFPERIGNA